MHCTSLYCCQISHVHQLFFTGSGTHSVVYPGNSVVRSESTQIVLVSDCRGFGISLNCDDVTSHDDVDASRSVPYISCIEPKSVAER